MAILLNAIECVRCGDIVVSEYRHDFKYCRCGKVAVDGGHAYLRRVSDTREDFLELSVEAA